MNFKVGDKICLRATITNINEDAIYPYYVNIELGENWTTDDFSCDSSAIVTVKSKDTSEKCSCLNEEYGKQVCYGTKEREQCTCEGDLMKCDFYQKEIDKMEQYMYTIAEPTEKGTVVTADLYNATLKEISYMNYLDILAVFDIPEYEVVRDKGEAIVYLIETHTPKEVVDIYEKYQDKFVVHKNDVIENTSSKKQYLVTKTCNCIAYLISYDGETNTTTIGCVERNEYKKVKSNVSIQDFFSKEV